MPRKRGPVPRFGDEIGKAFDYYTGGVLKIREIATALGVKPGTVMYLVKADPRYPEWKATQDASEAGA